MYVGHSSPPTERYSTFGAAPRTCIREFIPPVRAASLWCHQSTRLSDGKGGQSTLNSYAYDESASAVLTRTSKDEHSAIVSRERGAWKVDVTVLE